MSDVTCILTAIDGGNVQAASQLLPLVYEQLRRCAADLLARERPGQTLQATALVHEAYLRLIGKADPGWQSCGHFYAAAAEAMRRILVDNSRRKQALRHGGNQPRVELDGALEVAPPPRIQIANNDFKQTKEWKALNRYVGTWDAQGTTTVPEAKQLRSTPAATWILGDHFVQMNERATDVDAMYLLTYDQGRRIVRFWLFSSSGYTSTGSGGWDEATSTLTLKVDDPPPGGSGTCIDRFTDEDHHEWQWVFKDASGKVVFEVSGKATRLRKAPEKSCCGRANTGEAGLMQT